MIKKYFKDLIDTFKLKNLIYLTIVNFFLTGILYQCVRWLILPIFKDNNLPADITQLYTAVIFIPYAFKPVIGILSDLFSIFNYHKKYWIILFTLFSLLMCVLNLILKNMTIMILTFIVFNFQIAVTDLLTEGSYTKIMKEYPESGSNIVVFLNFWKNIGQVVAISFLGVLIDEKLYIIIFTIMGLVSFIIFIPTLLNWLKEEKSDVIFNKDLFLANKSTFSLIFFTGIFSLLISFLSIYLKSYIILIICLIVLSIIAFCTFLFFDINIFLVILYLMIVKISKPSLGSAMDYFYTANSKCLLDGPHFDFKYYITYTGVLGTVIIIITLIFYQLFLSKIKIRKVLIITSLLITLSGISDLIIVSRYNIRWGIPDNVFYIFGEAIVEKMISTLYLIPINTLISKLCKNQMESSTYAFLAGINELSIFVGKIEGVAIIDLANIKTIVPCDFSNLWWLIIVCHILPPIVIGIPSVLLLPNIYENENIVETEESEAIYEDDLL